MIRYSCNCAYIPLSEMVHLTITNKTSLTVFDIKNRQVKVNFPLGYLNC